MYGLGFDSIGATSRSLETMTQKMRGSIRSSMAFEQGPDSKIHNL
jgi:hypothetical protein